MKKTIGLISLGFVLLTTLSIYVIYISAAETVNIPWNWNGIIGTGQSLSVGAQANPAVTTKQQFNNMKLFLGDLNVPPFDVESKELSMVPLVEPIRPYATTYPGPYPGNIYGETPHTSMANEITSLVNSTSGQDYITVHTVVGESGQGMSEIEKSAVDNGSTGRAYAASLFEVEAINNLAAKAGKTYGVGAIFLTHGETDCGNGAYESEMKQLWSNYNSDIKEITGQAQDVKLITTQQHSVPTSGTAVGIQAQWLVGLNNPNIVCAGPNYYYNYDSDGIHLNSEGYRQLGEKYGKVYYETLVLGNDWNPLHPVDAISEGNDIVVDMHVPVEPLVWDTDMEEPNKEVDEWKKGKGFEVVSSSGEKIRINSVEISGNSIKIGCENEIEEGTTVNYAYTAQSKRTNGTSRWGLLKDSDPFVGYNTNIAQPNYCVSFQMDVELKDVTATGDESTETALPTSTEGIQSDSVTYDIINDWGEGATVNVTINNNTEVDMDGWEVVWTFSEDQKITNLWSGEYTQNDKIVSVKNTSYNKTIPSKNSVSFGFNLIYSLKNTKPTNIILK